MGTPNRHGIPKHPSTLPVPAYVPKPTGARAPATASRPSVSVVSTRAVDTWLRTLPQPEILQIGRHDTLVYDPAWTVDQEILISSLAVPDGMQYVITDVQFFALAPPIGLCAPSERMVSHALAGMLRFDLKFKGKPMKLEGTFRSLGLGTGWNQGTRSGWPFLVQDFGPRRMPSFALFATSKSTIKMTAVVDVRPHFPIDAIGVEFGGFAVPAERAREVHKR